MADINTNKIINFGNLSQYHTKLKNWISTEYSGNIGSEYAQIQLEQDGDKGKINLVTMQNSDGDLNPIVNVSINGDLIATQEYVASQLPQALQLSGEGAIDVNSTESTNSHTISLTIGTDVINTEPWNEIEYSSPILSQDGSGLKANLYFDYDSDSGKIKLNGIPVLTPSDWQNQLLKIVFADQLDTASATYANTLFVVPSKSLENYPEDSYNLCEEYICKETAPNSGVWYWELFGTTSIDFTYATNDDINSLFA